ncbi:MAG: hypothetical protein AAFY36_03790 [Bacteroidota bacterium]
MSSKNFSPAQPLGNNSGRNCRPQVEVIDQNVDPEFTQNHHQQTEDLTALKVFLKKNLAFKRPNPDLLTKIHERIDKLDT